MSNPVLELLNKKGIEFRVNGKDYLIKCLNPEHDDSNPSFRVDQTTGKAHCFSCGYKTTIFKHFGIADNFVSIKVQKLKSKMKALYEAANGAKFPTERVPFNKPFRGISAKTLRKFGAFYTNAGEENMQDRIFFPINDLTGKTKVFVGRHIHSAGNPRYLNYPRGATIPLFPEALETRASSVVIVEGIFDMLNLYDKGLKNVCCAFGTNTLQKDTGLKLLGFRAQGVTKIYIMFDGDVAGKTAAKTLKPLIELEGYSVEVIELPEGMDPGEMDQEYVDSIKEYVENETTKQE